MASALAAAFLLQAGRRVRRGLPSLRRSLASGTVVEEVRESSALKALVEESKTTRGVVLVCHAASRSPTCAALLRRLDQEHGKPTRELKIAALNVDLAAGVAEFLRITNLPTTLSLRDGTFVDSVVGMPPNDELERFLDAAAAPVGGANAEDAEAAAAAEEEAPDYLGEGAAALASGDVPTAAQAYSELLKASVDGSVDNARALAGLARCALADDPPDVGTARELVDEAKGALPDNAGVEARADVDAAAGAVALAADLKGVPPELAAKTDAELEETGKDKGGGEAAAGALNALALRRFVAGDVQGAIDAALLLVRRHRDWDDEAGRRLVLKFCDALGPQDERAAKSKRRLASLWYV